MNDENFIKFIKDNCDMNNMDSKKIINTYEKIIKF